jgi:hypothetical protein
MSFDNPDFHIFTPLIFMTKMFPEIFRIRGYPDNFQTAGKLLEAAELPGSLSFLTSPASTALKALT